MYGQIVPQSAFGFGVDTYTDVGFDSQYQYDGDKFSVTVKLTDILEYQRLTASVRETASPRTRTTASTASRPTRRSYGTTPTVSAPAISMCRARPTRTCLFGGTSLTNSSPNGDGLIADVAYLPFSHGSPGPYSTWNARLGVQYTHYLHLFGGTTNFDGSGLGAMHNASGNDTLLLYAWLMF